MAVEIIRSERVIQALKQGAGRLNDGGGLYLLPFAKSGAHYWRFDYVFQGRRRTLSLGVYPGVSLQAAREAAGKIRDALAQGIDPSQLRRDGALEHRRQAQWDLRVKDG